MNAILLALSLLGVSAWAERNQGGGGGRVVAAAAADVIFVAFPEPYRVNGQLTLRRLAPDGGVLWEQRWGRGRGEQPVALAVSADGVAALAGEHQHGCFALGLETPGRVLWETDVGAYGRQCRPAALALDGERNTYLLATSEGADGFDVMVWKLGSRGETLWSYRYDRPGSVYGATLGLDPRGEELRAFVQRADGGRFIAESFKLDASGRRLD